MLSSLMHDVVYQIHTYLCMYVCVTKRKKEKKKKRDRERKKKKKTVDVEETRQRARALTAIIISSWTFRFLHSLPIDDVVAPPRFDSLKKNKKGKEKAAIMKACVPFT